MAKVTLNDENLINIANAIRNKNGSETEYKPREMAQAILDIPTGGGSNKLEVGTFTVDADTNEYTYSGLSFKPKLIIVLGELGVAGVARTAYWVKNEYTGESVTCCHKSTNASITTVTATQYSAITNNGFTIKSYLTNLIVAGTYSFLALG